MVNVTPNSKNNGTNNEGAKVISDVGNGMRVYLTNVPDKFQDAVGSDV